MSKSEFLSFLKSQGHVGVVALVTAFAGTAGAQLSRTHESSR